jgi:hypothetical protein
MRPTGVRLVPKQDEGALVAAVDRAVADARRPERRVADGGEENLAAVVRLYERLTGERVLDRAASGAPAARHAHAMTAG